MYNDSLRVDTVEAWDFRIIDRVLVFINRTGSFKAYRDWIKVTQVD